MPLTIAQGADKAPRKVLFLLKALITVTSTDTLNSSWFRFGSLFVCHCIHFLREFLVTLSPAHICCALISFFI